MIKKDARWAMNRLEEIANIVSSSDAMDYAMTGDISSDISAFGAFIFTYAGVDPEQIMANNGQDGIVTGLATLFAYGYYCGAMNERSKHN